MFLWVIGDWRGYIIYLVSVSALLSWILLCYLYLLWTINGLRYFHSGSAKMPCWLSRLFYHTLTFICTTLRYIFSNKYLVSHFINFKKANMAIYDCSPNIFISNTVQKYYIQFGIYELTTYQYTEGNSRKSTYLLSLALLSLFLVQLTGLGSAKTRPR